MVQPGKDVVCYDKATGLEFCPLICQQSYDLCIHTHAHTHTPLYLIRGLRASAVEVFLRIYLSEEAALPETHNGCNLGSSDLLSLASLPPPAPCASQCLYCILRHIHTSSLPYHGRHPPLRVLESLQVVPCCRCLSCHRQHDTWTSQPHSHHGSWACRVLSPARQQSLSVWHWRENIKS